MTVLVVGNCTYDRSFELDRFPQPGETLLAHRSSADIGGKGANQAAAAACAGVPVAFCSVVGSDPEGAEFERRLSAADVDLRFLLRRDGPTDTSIIYLVPEGENAIVSSHALTDSLAPSDVIPALATLGPHDILLLQGNLHRETTGFCLREGHRQGAHVVLNPAPIHYGYDDLWPFVSIAIVNEVEAVTLGRSADPIESARTIVSKGVELVIATMGAAGALLIRRDEQLRIPAPPVNVVDTTGAGDVFCGVFAAGLARRLEPDLAARWAVAAASLSVTRRGTQRAFPTHEELASLLSRARLAD